MSDENGQEIGVNVYDEDELIEDDEEAAAPQPVEVVREEVVTVTKNPDKHPMNKTLGISVRNH